MRPFFALFMIFLVVFTPFTSAFSTAGEYCSPVADGCSAGSHCSGEEGSFLTTKCCPAGEEYNYYLDVCLEEGEVYVAEEALSNNNQNIVNSEEIISPDSSCYPWEKEADSMCVLSCPDCDSDGDRIKDKVEVRYYANPVIEIDGPAIRSLQKGCLGYYDFSYNQIETFQAEEYNPFSLFNSVPLFGMLSDDPSGPRQLGYGYGIGHGAIASVRDTGKGLLELFIVVPLIQFAPVFAAYKLQKNLPEVVQVLSGDEDVFQQSVDVMSNPLSEGKAEWYERRSDTAMEIKQYDSECDNVILTRRYTFSFVTGYLGAEIAMFFTPEAVVKVASKVRILSKFGKLGELAKAGAKIFSSEGEIKWLDALPSEVGKETAETVARIAAREGDEAARVAARLIKERTDVAMKAVSDEGRLNHAWKHANELGLGFEGKYWSVERKAWEKFNRDLISNADEVFTGVKQPRGGEITTVYLKYIEGKPIAVYVLENERLISKTIKLEERQLINLRNGVYSK